MPIMMVFNSKHPNNTETLLCWSSMGEINLNTSVIKIQEYHMYSALFYFINIKNTDLQITYSDTGLY